MPDRVADTGVADTLGVPSLPQLNQLLDSWTEVLTEPLWYQKVMPVLSEYWKKMPDNDQVEILKERFYQYFANKLDQNGIFLGSRGPNFDQKRLPIDQAVIHYTSNKPGISLSVLSAIGLLKQYAADYYQYDDSWGLNTKNQPIWSGHFQEGKQVFYAYHWLIRLNGKRERLLEDKDIGWHAGSGEVNCRSIGIVLDGEFLDSEPPEPALESIAALLVEQYPQIKAENVLGHLEVNPKTDCPGKLFLPIWKNKILNKLS